MFLDIHQEIKITTTTKREREGRGEREESGVEEREGRRRKEEEVRGKRRKGVGRGRRSGKGERRVGEIMAGKRFAKHVSKIETFQNKVTCYG